jgi:hypothetical protein
MSGIAPASPTPAAPIAPALRWTPARVLALIVGATLLGLSVFVSRGMALVGLLAMLVLVRVQSGRGRRATRAGAWLSCCAACAAGIILISAVGFARLPAGMMDRAMNEVRDSMRAQQRRTPPPTLPPALQRLQPQDSASRAAALAVQVQAIAMVGSPGFMRYMVVAGISIGSAMAGMILGTAAWVAAFLLARGFSGVWPLAPPPTD